MSTRVRVGFFGDQFQTGADMNSPPIAFEYEGLQYVGAYSGGNLFAGSPRGDRLWLFSLNGTMEPAPTTSAAPAANPAAAAGH